MATRFYLQNTEAAAVSPAYHASWTNTAEASRWAMYPAKGLCDTAMAVGTRIGPWTAGQKALDRQYVSAPMAAGNNFTSATIKSVVRCAEFATTDNVRPYFGAEIVSKDGSTVRQVLLAPNAYFASAELGTTSTTRRFADGDTVGGSYTTVDGDRLVIYIGYQDSTGTTPEAQGYYGDLATESDAPENEATTSSVVPWAEVSVDINFLAEATTNPDGEWLFNEGTGSIVEDFAGAADFAIDWPNPGSYPAAFAWGSGYAEVDTGWGGAQINLMTPTAPFDNLGSFTFVLWGESLDDTGSPGAWLMLNTSYSAADNDAVFMIEKYNTGGSFHTYLYNAASTASTIYSDDSLGAVPADTKYLMVVRYSRVGGASNNVLSVAWTTNGRNWKAGILKDAVLSRQGTGFRITTGDGNVFPSRFHRMMLYKSFLGFPELQGLFALGSEGAQLSPVDMLAEASGSVAFSGSAAAIQERTMEASGSVDFGGTADIFESVILAEATSSVDFSGSAAVDGTLLAEAESEIEIDGGGDTELLGELQASSGLIFGGIADVPEMTLEFEAAGSVEFGGDVAPFRVPVPDGGFPVATLLIGNEDFSEYLTPESIRYANRLTRQTYATLDFNLKDVPADFEVRGGQRVDFYLPGSEYPLFSGQILETMPIKHSVANWTFRVRATSWEQLLYRRQSYIAFRNLTFEQAVNAVLQDPDQFYPEILARTCLNSGVLSGDMPFYSFSGVHPADIFNMIAELSSSAWRIIQGADSSEQVVEFYDPRIYAVARPFLFSNTSNSFKWTTFQPRFDLNRLINSQTVRGAIQPASTNELALFRGDNLNSKFPLPVKPYSNTARVELYDSFDGLQLNESYWFESDTNDNDVYQLGDGFLQLEPPAIPQWIGIQSRINVERSNTATVVFDMTSLEDGALLMGFSDINSVPANPEEFLEAGIYIDETGLVNLVADHAIVDTSTLTLDDDTQYRFRITVRAEGGCKLEYQTGINNYTRNWTPLLESADGSVQDLQIVAMNYSADWNLASVKCTNPYLGLKLEVDRGMGFQEEFVGVYQIDDDLDAVIEDEQAVSFFGSDPGPSSIPPAPALKEFTVASQPDDLLTVVGGHGLINGCLVLFSSAGTPPTGLVHNTTYYLHANSYTSFSLYDTAENAIAGGLTGRVDISSDGAGTQTIIPTSWIDKDSDYKNIRVTYKRGVTLQATYQDTASIVLLRNIFDDDDGIREGVVIVDEKLTSYQSCVDRAELEVKNNNEVMQSIISETRWNLLRQAGMKQPYLGDSARFSVQIDRTGYLIEGDIPIMAMEVSACKGANDFDIRFEAGWLQEGFKDILKSMLDSGQLVSSSDADLLIRSKFVFDQVSLADAVDALGYNTVEYWGDDRMDREFTVNTGTDVVTLDPDNPFQDGQKVYVSSTTTLPAPLLADTIYVVGSIAGATLKLYDDNGVLVDLTTAGTGTHTIQLAGWKWGLHAWNGFFIDTAEIEFTSDYAVPTIS